MKNLTAGFICILYGIEVALWEGLCMFNRQNKKVFRRLFETSRDWENSV